MREEEPASYHQEIRVESGMAYGVLGADLHVYGDHVLLYLLENWRDATDADPKWLRELPGRLLNAGHAATAFTGRTAELSQLHQWRRDDALFAVRWLHGPTGIGRTLLAAKFASEATADRWKVVVATLGPGAVLPVLAGEDLRPGPAEGTVLVIDAADRWTETQLGALLSNKLFRRPDGGMRTRVLMTGATLDGFPAIRHKLIGERALTSSQQLRPLEPRQPGPALETDTFPRVVS